MQLRTRGSTHACLKPAVCAAALALGMSCARAETLIALGGINQPDDHAESTYAWQVEYQENLASWLAASLSWLNEGHLPDDHRDGAAAQLWVRAPSWHDLTFSFGAGPYFYFDTEARDGNSTYADAHGIGGIATASIAVDLGASWFVSLNASGIYTPGDIHTYDFMLGVGYRFVPLDRSLDLLRAAADSTADPGRQQLQAFGGMKIFNDLNAQQKQTFGLDYHVALNQAAAWSATWFDDPGSAQSLHDRIASQFWLVRQIDRAHLALSIGLGGYYQFGTPITPTASFERLSGLSGIRAEWEPTRRLSLIFTWYRKFTTDNTDRDLLTLGAGWRF
jgi:hypothetical protein